MSVEKHIFEESKRVFWGLQISNKKKHIFGARKCVFLGPGHKTKKHIFGMRSCVFGDIFSVLLCFTQACITCLRAPISLSTAQAVDVFGGIRVFASQADVELQKRESQSVFPARCQSALKLVATGRCAATEQHRIKAMIQIRNSRTLAMWSSHCRSDVCDVKIQLDVTMCTM